MWEIIWWRIMGWWVTFNIAIAIKCKLMSWRKKSLHLREVTGKVTGKAVGRDVRKRNICFFNCFSYNHFLIKCFSSRFKCFSHSCWVYSILWWQKSLYNKHHPPNSFVSFNHYVESPLMNYGKFNIISSTLRVVFIWLMNFEKRLIINSLWPFRYLKKKNWELKGIYTRKF